MVFEGYISLGGTVDDIKESVRACMATAPMCMLVGETATELYYSVLGSLHPIRFLAGSARLDFDIMSLSNTEIYGHYQTGALNVLKVMMYVSPYMAVLHFSGPNPAWANPVMGVFVTSAGRLWVLNMSTLKCSPDGIDNFNYQPEKIYFDYKTEQEHYTLIPARILDNSQGMVLPELPYGLYGVMALPTNNSFYTFPDGSTCYYKDNLIYK